MAEINLLDLYPKSNRPIEERGRTVSEEDRRISRLFGKEYFDGDRMHGYGGYSYHPRFWQKTVRRFRDHYNLPETAAILDVGCGKGFMLHDFKELMPKSVLAGIDISEYAISHAMDDIAPLLRIGNAKELPFPNKSFDLVVSINTIHNLAPDECRMALKEIERVSRGNSFISVDAWRNDEEKNHLLQWNLTALTYMHVTEWKKFFAELGYSGDYWWFIA